MNLVLLLSIILAAQLPLYTFGKSSFAAKAITVAVTEGPKSHKEATSSIVAEKDDAKGTRMRRNSLSNDDDDGDFLINKLSREYVTSNLFDSTCNK
jgi:hypothetical protein